MKKRFFVMAAIIISSHLQAQNDTTSLDEIVVTANKYPNKSSLTGKVIRVITRQQLEKSGGKDLSQLLTEQTGLYINGANSNPGKDKSVYLRGARVDHTLITIDGIPVYDASGIGGNFDIRNMPIENIERIEILKGSQSTLFGSDAIAGVINIITKKGSTSKLGGSAALSYGSNSTIKGSAGINGKQGVIDYNAGVTFFDTKGINEATNKNNQPGTDKDRFTQKAAQANLGFQLNKNIKLQPYFRYSSLEGAIDQGAFTDELDYDYTQKSWQGGLRTEMAFGNLKLNLLYNYNDIDRVYTDDSIKSRNGFNIWSKGQYKGSEHFIDLFAHIALNQKLKLTAGTDFRSSSSEQDYQSVSIYGNSSSQLSSDSLKQTQVSLYAALNYNNENGFNLELGNRLNIHSEYGTNDVFNINPSYLIRRRVKIFMNLSTGYRTPSLYQL
ncbi:MAG TPA: TonB-dependent receptor, partial [Chitinophagaceae bacterium]|nr:TonB-dependent receptor [Chitinophagaceae bacterium]